MCFRRKPLVPPGPVTTHDGTVLEAVTCYLGVFVLLVLFVHIMSQNNNEKSNLDWDFCTDTAPPSLRLGKSTVKVDDGDTIYRLAP